jgi:hypothetical protein
VVSGFKNNIHDFEQWVKSVVHVLIDQRHRRELHSNGNFFQLFPWEKPGP